MSNNPAWLQADAMETQDVTPLAPNTSSTGPNQGSSNGDGLGDLCQRSPSFSSLLKNKYKVFHLPPSPYFLLILILILRSIVCLLYAGFDFDPSKLTFSDIANIPRFILFLVLAVKKLCFSLCFYFTHIVAID